MDGHSQNGRHEDAIPNMTPGPVAEVMAQTSELHAELVVVGDAESRLILAQGVNQTATEVHDAWNKSQVSQCAHHVSTYRASARIGYAKRLGS